MVWSEITAVTECRFSWWGNYSPHSDSRSHFLHLEVFTCLVCFSPSVNHATEEIPPIRREGGLFFSTAWRGGQGFQPQIHTWEIFRLHLVMTPKTTIVCNCTIVHKLKDNLASFIKLRSDVFYSRVCWGATGNLRSNGVCFWCVCCGEATRADAGQRGLSGYPW